MHSTARPMVSNCSVTTASFERPRDSVATAGLEPSGAWELCRDSVATAGPEPPQTWELQNPRFSFMEGAFLDGSCIGVHAGL